MDDRSFRNWPARVLYWMENNLFLVSLVAGVGVALFATSRTAASIFRRSIDVPRRLRNMNQPVNATKSLGEQISWQDRYVSRESPTEQPPVAGTHDMDVEKDAELPPQLRCHVAV